MNEVEISIDTNISFVEEQELYREASQILVEWTNDFNNTIGSITIQGHQTILLRLNRGDGTHT